MANIVKLAWKRSEEGFATTHCGRYELVPQYYGCTQAQDYQLWFYPDSTANQLRGRLPRESLGSVDTHRLGKEIAQDHHLKQMLKLLETQSD